jgi:hypothetical protein
MSSGYDETTQMTTAEHGENRVRHLAERRGLRVAKSRQRDPSAADYGRYMLRDAHTRIIVAGATSTGRALWTLDNIKTYLSPGLVPDLRDAGR